MNVNSGDGFDRLLEQELQRATGSLEGPTPSAVQSAYHAALTSGGPIVSIFSSLTAALTTKVAVAATAATLVVGGATAGAVASGSPNPTNWGSAVVQAVKSCKDAARAEPAATSSSNGLHIGKCVSTFAKKHGAAKRAEHEGDATTKHSEGKPSDLQNDKDKKTDKHSHNGKPDETGKPKAASDGSHPSGTPDLPPPHR